MVLHLNFDTLVLETQLIRKDIGVFIVDIRPFSALEYQGFRQHLSAELHSSLHFIHLWGDQHLL